MRVLQVIDTLEAGGAEQMAVNIANALQGRIEGSFLCCTRKEGILKERIDENVEYCFLNKTSTLDRKALLKLRNYISENKIDIVHAHSSSYFLVTLIKLLFRKKFKIVWHDHYGNSEYLEERPLKILKLCSVYFDGIISVNEKLAGWARNNLKCRKVSVFRNFLISDKKMVYQTSVLKGDQSDFKFICVANLRPQKDHFTLIKAFENLDSDKASLHLVGKDFKDEYSIGILKLIENSPKKDKIFYYGSRENVWDFLKEANAGVLASKSEGLPLVLLEYGLAGLPVICTEVGECRKVIGDLGILVPPSDVQSLRNAFKKTIENPKFRNVSKEFQKKIVSEYLDTAIIPKIINFYHSI